MIDKDYCGPLIIDLAFDGSLIGTSTTPIKEIFTCTSGTDFCTSVDFYSEDFGLIGSHMITVTGHFQDYPTAVAIISNSLIVVTIDDPCLSTATFPPYAVPMIANFVYNLIENDSTDKHSLAIDPTVCGPWLIQTPTISITRGGAEYTNTGLFVFDIASE